MSNRVRWTVEERNRVFDRAVLELHNRNCTGLKALQVAQQLTLPTHRQRTLATHSAAHLDIQKIQALYKSRLSALLAGQAKVTPMAPVEPPPAPPVPPPAPQPELTLDELVQAIATKVAGVLTQSIKREIKELEHTFHLQKHNPTYASSKIYKPHVVVIGLLPDQAHIIEREFGDRFALKFIRSDDAKHADIPQGQAYLLMKNFIDHSVYHKYQPLPQHVLIDGGMATLRMWLNTKGAEL